MREDEDKEKEDKVEIFNHRTPVKRKTNVKKQNLTKILNLNK